MRLTLTGNIVLGNSISHNNDNIAKKEGQLIMSAFIHMSISQVGDHISIKSTEYSSHRQGC